MKHPDIFHGLPLNRAKTSPSKEGRAIGSLSAAKLGGRELLSLDGEWQLAFDKNNRGRAAHWENTFPSGAVSAPVPSVWERIRPDYDGVGWYRRTFELPADWERRTLRLRFHAAQYHAVVWLNGELLGEHEGGFLPFEFDVSSQVREGENTLVVRVVNPPMDREIDGFRCGAPLNQGPIPVGKAGWYYNFGGLWQSVELQATDGATLTRVSPEPKLSPDEVTVKISVELDGPPATYEIVTEISGMDGQPAAPTQRLRRRLKKGLNHLSLRVPLSRARRWSPEDPYLHTARVTVLRDGNVQDTLAVRFGMREFIVRDGRFRLNGSPVILKGFLHQGSYPRTLVRPEDRAMSERELRAVKERGFNFVRAHMQPALPSWLDLCDELGLLVMAEPPLGWIERTPQAEARCWREIEGLVKRDAHHASIVVWCLMNEVFHLRGFTPEVVIGMTARWMQRVRLLDPTRAIIDVSGGHGLLSSGGAEDMLPDTAQQGLTAVYAPPGEGKTEPVLDAHVYHEFPPRDETFKRLRTLGIEGMLFFLSEYGAPPVPPLFDEVLAAYSRADRDAGLEDYRLHADFAESLRLCFEHPAVRQACRDPRSFLTDCNRLRAEDMHAVTVALRSNPRVGGYCFCQLADASGELFGALDVWRHPKPVMEALTQATDAGALGIFVTPRVAAPGTPVQVELVWLGGDTTNLRGKSGKWALEMIGPDGVKKKRWTKTFRVAKSATPQRLLSITIPAPSRTGEWRWTASGMLDGLTLHGHFSSSVVTARPRLRGAVAVNGMTSPLTIACQELGLDVSPFGNNFREIDMPVLMDLSKPSGNRQHWFEELGQLRKVLQVGGCAVVFDPEMALVHEVFPEAEIRMQPMMRPVGYTVAGPVFGGLPAGGLMDFTWAELGASRHDKADDVRAKGGSVLAGALSFNMWTRPADFQHGASLYTLPVGRGTLVVCHHRILAARAEGHPVADLLLAGLVNVARAHIRFCNTDGLLSRCIDPIRENET
jgi:beta-galactosidase